MQVTEPDLFHFNLRVNRIDQLDDEGQECDRQQHEADDDGLYPQVEAQATFTGLDGDPYFLSGCLDCVRQDVAAHANPDRLIVIEMGH
jgi:hypothetical protein